VRQKRLSVRARKGVMDLVYLGLTLLCFGLAYGLLRLCERI
jgi:hypothetical protein